MAHSVDIVFINPPLIWGQENRLDIKPPLNLIYLASYVNSKGFCGRVIDVISEGIGIQEVLNRIAEINPKFIGVPFYQGTRDTALELCQKVKKLKHGIIVIAGGPLVTTLSDEIVREDSIDLCVIGEGELTVEEILRSKSENWMNIQSLAFKENGKVYSTAAREPIFDLDSLPFLDFSLINSKVYYDFQKSLNMPIWLFFSTSRGCPFKCVFCATPVLWPGKTRRNSVKRVIEEIKYQLSKEPEVNIGFMDDSFFSDKKWLNDFFTEIEKLKIKYCCIGRADQLSEAEIKLLAKTGCHYVGLGVETGNSLRQKKLKKFLNLEKLKFSVDNLARNGILVKCFFMLGFPDEKPEEMLETINLAVDLKKLGMSECNFFSVSIYPGTELAKNFNFSNFSSKIYEKYDPENRSISVLKNIGEDIGEKRLSIYGNISGIDINPHYSREKILDVVKLSYNKVEKGEYASLQEMNELCR
ncbi:MAG: B12-binding domain-containing radical SAM protein [Candidatus Riflebacteria bacterium]|nr:B12-binding domain-containing radical SAM protein [Candidatus Riflebacteria bacterium]